MKRYLLLSSALVSTAFIAGCPSASTPTKPEERIATQPGATTDGGAAEEVDGGTAALPVMTGDGGVEEAKEAHSAATERTSEEKELAAKKAEQKAAAAKLKAIADKLAPEFNGAFSSIKAGKDDDAIQKYLEMIKNEPEVFAAHYNIGVLYERKGLRDQAIKEYQQALKLKPDYEPASDNLSRLYLRAGQSDKAEAELRQRILAYPRILAFRNQLVRVMMAEGRQDQAESDSKKILKIDERNVDAMLNLALIWYGQKKFELAKQVLEAARDVLDKEQADSAGKEADPYAPAVWNLLAFTQRNLDQRALALESFRKAAELRPDYPEAHNNYGAMLNEVNDCDAATQELELAVRYAPDYAEAHLNLGNAYRCAHRYKEAQDEYNKTLALNPKSPDPVFNTAILYLDGFDLHVDFAKTDPLDSEKLERIKTAIKYFDQYKAAGGEEDRFDRYYEEAQKAQAAEIKRLEGVKKRGEHDKERELEKAAKKAAAEAKAKLEAEAKQSWVKQWRISPKADLDDGSSTSTTPVVAPVSTKPATSGTVPATAVVPAPIKPPATGATAPTKPSPVTVPMAPASTPKPSTTTPATTTTGSSAVPAVVTPKPVPATGTTSPAAGTGTVPATGAAKPGSTATPPTGQTLSPKGDLGP